MGAKLEELGAGAATIAASFRLLRTILSKAVLAGIINRNPATGIKTPKAETGEMHFATAKEVARLGSAVGGRYEALVYLRAYGACESERLPRSRWPTWTSYGGV